MATDRPPAARGPDQAAWYVRALPALVIVLPALLSLAAWLGPVADHGLTGYFTRSHVTPWGVALVIAWFGSLIAVAQFGFARGRRQGPLAPLGRVSVDEVHRWTCAVGLFGTGWAYWVASGGSVSRIVELWKTQQFNTLRQGFDYGVGVPTLRYATILAGALTLVHLFRRGRPRLVDALSLVGLIATSFLASRLAVTAAVFIAVTVFFASGRVRRPRISTVLIGVLVGVALFSALNYSRNAGTYREKGVDNPVAMAAVNAQSYLAAPTQVTLGFATLVMEGRISPPAGGLESAEVLLPTYASPEPAGRVRSGSISSVVEVSPSLTTNGAFTSLLFQEDWAKLIAALVAVGFAAWAAGRFLVSGSIGPAIAGVLLYGMAELWRIFLFNQGILHFLVLIGIVALVVGKLREPAAAASAPSTRPLA
jgi:hypothetical protein